MPATTSIILGGRQLAVGPASLGTVRAWLTAQENARVGSLEYVDAIGTFVHASLARYNGDLERDWLEDQLDEHNLQEVLSVIYQAGGLKNKGEAAGTTTP